MLKRSHLGAACILVAALILPTADAAERVERGNLVLEGIPEIPQSFATRLEQYQNTRSAGLAGWLPGGGMLISTRFAETSQIHRVDRPGGARTQLTFFSEPVGGGTPSPNPEMDGFLFTRDVGGSEFYQIYFFDLETGASTLLTDGESRNGAAVWSNDGRRFAFYTTRRNGRDHDIHVASIDRPGESRPVLEREGAWFPGGWSPDDSTLLVLNYVSANESYPYLLDLEDGEMTALHTADEPVSYGEAVFSRDGKGLYFTSDEGSEFQRLRYHDLATGERRVLTGDIDWNVESLEISHDGRRLAFTVNREGWSELHVRDLEAPPGEAGGSGAELDLPELPGGLVYDLELSPDDERLGFVVNGPTGPGDVYDLQLATGTLTRWTASEVGGLNRDTFVAPQLIRFPTFDTVDGERRTIPSFYYRPEGEGPFPVVVDIHGGPEGQERPAFSPTAQFWVKELGLAVLAPNVRGSDGYGKSYLKLDNGRLREDSVKDIGALLDWIATRPELDASRIAVYGGSYGGYMSLASLVHYDDRLAAGVDLVGISSFVTFLTNTEDYRRDLRRAEYGDESDPAMRAFLEKISPLSRIDEVTTPLLVIQGANDPRVPASESEQVVAAVRENGGEVWYLLAKDEGHGFRKKSNRDAMAQSVALFLEEFLIERATE